MNKKEQKFVDVVWDFYTENGRQALPWRRTHDAYCVLVSELMLQQTQVERVIPKYQAFIKKWPTVHSLAKAKQSDVLIAWQGLGYNRRAKFLHQCAQTMVADYAGIFPQTRGELEKLPGIGPYTAGAILAFAYNQPVVLIETNVRRVYLHHFFPTQEKVADTEILAVVKKTLPPEKAREWYAALMDYGTYLKRTIPNPNVRSKHYSKQSTFKGSDREIRGALLRLLAISALSEKELKQALAHFKKERIEVQVYALIKEGLIREKKKGYYSL